MLIFTHLWDIICFCKKNIEVKPMKKLTVSKMTFFFIAVILLWLKSYFLYLIEFNLDISNGIQQFLLFFNPLSSALIFLGIALFAKGRKAGIWIITIYSLMSLFLYAQAVFFRANSDYITLPTLTQTSNFGSLGGSIASLITWTDLFYALDIVVDRKSTRLNSSHVAISYAVFC